MPLTTVRLADIYVGDLAPTYVKIEPILWVDCSTIHDEEVAYLRLYINGQWQEVQVGGTLPKPEDITVTDPNTIKVTFGDCISPVGVDPYGFAVFTSDDNGQSWDRATINVAVATPVVTITVAPALQPGQLIRVTYTSPGLEDCEEGEPLDDFDKPVDNPITLEGDYILLETGGVQVLLLENDDDIDPPEGYKLEVADT